MHIFYDWPFLHMSNLQENVSFSSLILGSVFSDYVVFYVDMFDQGKCADEMHDESL